MNLRSIEVVKDRIRKGEPFRVRDFDGKPFLDWTTAKITPDFSQIIDKELEARESIIVEIGREVGEKQNGEMAYKGINQNFPFTIIKKETTSHNPFQSLGTMENQNLQTMFLTQKIQELKDEVREYKADKKENLKEIDSLRNENNKLQLSLSVKDKEHELEVQKQRYHEGNSLAGVLKELAKPETSESLSGYVSAIKGQSAEKSSNGGSLQGIDTDAKRAVLDKLKNMSEKETLMLWNTINSKDWNETLKKQG